MVIDGVADISWCIPSYTPGRFPDTEVLELPGMFTNLRESSAVAMHLAQDKVLHDYATSTSSGCSARRLIQFTPTSVNSIADLKGKTIRASSATESATLRALGAVPIGCRSRKSLRRSAAAHQRHHLAYVAIL